MLCDRKYNGINTIESCIVSAYFARKIITADFKVKLGLSVAVIFATRLIDTILCILLPLVSIIIVIGAC